MKEFSTLFIWSCMQAVDTFFWIGGFFTAYTLLDPKFHDNGKFTLSKSLLAFLHRIARIWPSFAAALFIYWQILPFLSNGPAWSGVWMASDYFCGKDGGWYKK